MTDAPETREKTCPAKTNMPLQNPGLIACYDIRPGNGVVSGPILTTRSPHGANYYYMNKIVE